MAKRGEGKSGRSRLILSIDKLYEDITVDPDDKILSKKLVDETLAKIIGHIRNKQHNGKLYDHRKVKAGSHAVNAKIGKADEFDMNVPLNICNFTFRTHMDNGINYTYQDRENSNMMQNLQLTRTWFEDVIPFGYAVVEKEEDQELDFGMFKHFYGFTQANVSSRGNTELIPRDIKQDFHSKIGEAIRVLNLDYVKLDDYAHGPALTLTISQEEKVKEGEGDEEVEEEEQEEEDDEEEEEAEEEDDDDEKEENNSEEEGEEKEVDHKVDVDLTLSLKIPLRIETFGWPREATWLAFSEDQIERVLDAGIHLVPKKNLFWSISFYRGERALLSGIDADNGCRKMTLKILKYLMEVCKFQSFSKLRGMSSHILKTQVLWSCEKHGNERNYWNRGNRDLCIVNTINELVSSLRNGYLPDYFNCEIDVLAGKKSIVLNELADYMSKVLMKISQM